MPAKRRSRGSLRGTGSPFLRGVESLPEAFDAMAFPFNVRAFSHGIELTFRSKVTFFVGENGSGKSTLLEAIAECCGFNPEGGNRDHHRATLTDRSPLAKAIRLSSQSHGKSFLALFLHRFEQGIYILDEPEAALSPQRQLSFLRIIHDLTAPGHAQFLIATHSPILLSYPDAVLYDLDGDSIRETTYRETKHFLITRDFLNAPEQFFKHLFATPEDLDPDG